MESRIKIWRGAIYQALKQRVSELQDGTEGLNEWPEMVEFSRWDLTLREITNIVTTAQRIAGNSGRRLQPDDIRMVAEFSRDFDHLHSANRADRWKWIR